MELALLATLATQGEQGAAAQRDEIYHRAGVERLQAFALHLEPLATHSQEGVILEQVDRNIGAASSLLTFSYFIVGAFTMWLIALGPRSAGCRARSERVRTSACRECDR